MIRAKYSALFLLSVKETVQTSYLSITGIPTLFAAQTSAAGQLSQRGERVKGRLWADSGCCYRDKSCSSRTSRSPLHSYLSHILYNKLCLWWSSPGQWCLLLWSENFKTWGRFFGTPCRSSELWAKKFAESFDKSFWLWAYSHCSVWSMFCSQGSRHTWQSAPVRHCNILDKVLKKASLMFRCYYLHLIFSLQSSEW